MTDAQFKAELAYQTAASLLKNWKEQGLVTGKEYRRIHTLLLKKYRPLVGGLCN